MSDPETRAGAGAQETTRRAIVAASRARQQKPLTPPSARRLASARMADTRLWLGIALVLGSVGVGVAVMSADGDTITVYRAARDLPVGATPTQLDRVVVSRSAAGEAYVTSEPAVNAVVRYPIRAGELVPREAIAVAEPRDHRQVTVAVDPLHAPVDLQSGDRVDVWASPGSSREGGPPRLVVAGARVATVSADAVGVSGEIAVVLDLAPADVAAVVEAVRSGVVDLVTLPIDSQPFNEVTS